MAPGARGAGTVAGQVFGGMSACEPRYVVDVIDGMVEDGLEVVFG